MRKFSLIVSCLVICFCGFAVTVFAQTPTNADLLLLKLVESPTPDFLTIESLINDGADIDVADENGETALMKAARTNNDVAVAEILIGWGANINAVDAKYETALMKAAQYNPNPRMIELLGRLGAQLDSVDDSGETALMKACKYTVTEEVVTRLLLMGADPTLTTNRKMAYDFAKKNSALKGTETLEILKELSR